MIEYIVLFLMPLFLVGCYQEHVKALSTWQASGTWIVSRRLGAARVPPVYGVESSLYLDP